MSIVLYNTKTKKKDVFVPLIPGQVSMYVCGVTVYDDCHLGHARSALTFDMIRRYFEFAGYQVKYVRNFTDIDDKILNRAKQEDVPWHDISERYIQNFYRDMGALGITKPTAEPRATEHMQDILNMIEGLEKNGIAYQLEGDVYFSVKKFALYGQLSGKNLEELQAGARVEVDTRKQDPMDFALWKAAKQGEPGWDSPWGKGRPGWHIECSAMSVAELGPTFDIHGGGKDLIFPHHENEIAQSCAYTGKEFARYWVHNGFVTVDKEKMSKSLGNFFTIREILDKSSVSDSEAIIGECLRYYLLSTHYRSDLNFSEQSLPEAKSAMDTIYGLIQRLEEPGVQEQPAGEGDLESILKQFSHKFHESMDDDFNSPKALAVFHQLRGEINKLLVKGVSKETKGKILEIFKKYGEPLGIFQIDLRDWKFGIVPTVKSTIEHTSKVSLTIKLVDPTEEWIEQQIQLRNEARAQKDFSTADTIRKELAEQGIILEDRPDGTTRWKR
ncbi:MAG: cysteine--tRNA ligase [Nitrospirota bacterium]|nr:cysteine--tRNA ligase [Nitrospirota bacterium]